jgi:hypothetical protein
MGEASGLDNQSGGWFVSDQGDEQQRKPKSSTVEFRLSSKSAAQPSLTISFSLKPPPR